MMEKSKENEKLNEKMSDEFCILGRPETSLSVPILHGDLSISVNTSKGEEEEEEEAEDNGKLEEERIILTDESEEVRMRNKSQIRMMYLQSLGCLVFVTCLIGAFCSDGTSAVIWGAGLSLVCTLGVIFSYVLQPYARRHPNSLIFYRAVCEFCFALKSLIFLCAQCYGASFQCDSLSFGLCSLSNGLSQFFLLAGEGWYGASIVDLFWSMTNPFTDYKRNITIYHLLIWSTSGIIASCSPYIFSSTWLQSNYGLDKQQLCNQISLLSPQFYEIGNRTHDELNKDWREINLIYWGVVFAYIFVLLIAAQVIIILSWKRSQSGLEAALNIRRQKIKKMTFYVEITHAFWMCFIVVFFVYLFHGTQRTFYPYQHSYMETLFNFLITGRGYFSFVVWFAVNDSLRLDLSCSSFRLDYSANVDYSPQMNGPLRSEIIYYTVNGIKKALRNAAKRTEPVDIQELLLNPQNSVVGSANSTFVDSTIISSNDDVRLSATNSRGLLGSPDFLENDIDLQSRSSSISLHYHSIRRTPRSFTKNQVSSSYGNSKKPKQFVDYAPHEFKKVRESFGITDEAYMKSLSTTTKERLSEGASGAFMFYSADGALIVKSMSRNECHKLISIVHHYATYMVSNPNSLITRFYGCHRIKLYGQNFYFVVMANIFETSLTIHDRYDVKGSWVNRKAKHPKEGELVTCRHCNAKYHYWNPTLNASRGDDFDSCFHQPNVVMKDSELEDHLKIPLSQAKEIYYQVRHDGDFLCSMGILDYSLLIGIHHSDNENPVVLDRKDETCLPCQAGSDVYFMGIIDILETWNLRKQMEHYFKVTVLCRDKAGISAVPPEKYRDRFQAKIGRLLGNPVC